MPTSTRNSHHATQPSPTFPTPEQFKIELLRYAKVCVVLGGVETVGDLIPQYREGNRLGVRIEVRLETVLFSGNELVSWDESSQAGYVRVRDFHLSAVGIDRIELSGDAKIPYKVVLDRRVPPPAFEPFLTESAEPA